jgi:hypothetical protein
MWMDDSAWWQISMTQLREARPRHESALILTQQDMTPCATDFPKELG